MKSVVGRARLIWGASEGELAFCAVLVGIAITLCSSSISDITDKFGETELLSLATPDKVCWAERCATGGRREAGAKALDASEVHGRNIFAVPVAVGDGSGDYQFTSELAGVHGGVVTIRPSVSTSGSGALVWLCGRKPAPRGFVALGQDRTNLPDEKLFFACRSHS